MNTLKLYHIMTGHTGAVNDLAVKLLDEKISKDEAQREFKSMIAEVAKMLDQ